MIRVEQGAPNSSTVPMSLRGMLRIGYASYDESEQCQHQNNDKVVKNEEVNQNSSTSVSFSPIAKSSREAKSSDKDNLSGIMASPARRRSSRFNKVEPQQDATNDSDSEAEEKEYSQQQMYEVDGIKYETYQEMVDAKRKRNQQRLQDLGFLDSTNLQLSIASAKKAKAATQRGIRSKRQKVEPFVSRKSSRLSGDKTSLVSLDYYVANWNTDNSIVKVEGGEGGVEEEKNTPVTPSSFRGRLNDGEDLTLEEAIELNEPKFIFDNSVKDANDFHQDTLLQLGNTKKKKSTRSPKSVVTDVLPQSDIDDMINNLSIDDTEWVAKVTPDRIYSVSAHPSESKTIACAGDKQGYIGLWDVDAVSEENDGCHLFHVHSRPVCCLEWASWDTMVSASYDGTVRQLNVETGTFQQVFATYDSDSRYANELGYGLDSGYRFWLQHVTVDPRHQGSSNPSLFLSTSAGTALHVDLRASEKQVTFNETLSEKKINSLSLHPDGYTLASAGLDCTVNLWDIRKFGSRGKKTPKPIGSQSIGRSVNSAFFSPSGNSLLTTSMANRLDLIDDAHLQSGTLKPTKSIKHDNQTGRWLVTFQARWHPQLDIFVSGSMGKPRRMESFDSKGRLIRAVTGEELTSVMSRCCYHPSTEKLTMIGGNSSGRVAVIR